ncbi:PXA domain-containing protein [Bisporella sp. PMI_857]|nr:PXA domain-containing protein [Bisporella sp. PMI_857]
MSRLQPRLKALATSNVSAQSASASNDPIARNETPISRQNARLSSADPLSERATLFLIRRTLCSQLGEKGRSTPAPINEVLPPLTSSNEIDVELYAFIAIIIKEFVHTWYTKITPDHIFVEEVVQIIAHCTRALEQRLRKVDLEGLVFDELPELLEVHLQAYRTATQPLNPLPYEPDPRQIYHALCPLPALSPAPGAGQDTSQELMDNEAAYRQLLVQAVMAILLPTEDLENECLTSLVGQILSEMIVGGGIGGKASEPWMLWDGITKITEVIQSKLPKSTAQVRLERSNSLSRKSGDVVREGMKDRGYMRWLQKMFWLVLQYTFVAFTAIRFIIITMATASSLPSRSVLTMKITGSDKSKDVQSRSHIDIKMLAHEHHPPLKQPILKMKIWSCASSLLDVATRMPWLSATISMLQWGALAGPGELANTDGMIDKILSHFIKTHILDPTLLPQLLRTARGAVFPNNAPGPPRMIPSPADQLLIRQQCAEAILSLIPTRIQDIYFGPGVERRVHEVEEVLNCFSDSYCNKHLLYGAVELIIVRLMPELAEKGVEELLAERLG